MVTTRPTDPDPRGPLLEVYLAKRPELVRFFTARTGSAQDAEEIVQDIYLRLARAPEGGVENAAAWLYRTGANLLLDRVRARGRTARRDDAWFRLRSIQAGGDDTADLPTPEAALDARRRFDTVLTIVRAMPAQRRRVFEMHKLEGLSHGDVAARLGISRSAVEKHIMAALKQLAEATK